MKTKSLGKGILSVVLVLLLIMSMVPMSAFALTVDDTGKVTSTTFSFDGLEYGNQLTRWGIGCELGTSIITNKAIIECDSPTFDISKLKETTDEYFAANKQYYVLFQFEAHPDGDGFAESFGASNIALTCNGENCEQVFYIKSSDGSSYTVGYKLPVLEAVAFEVPFTKVVEQVGDIAPTSETFELEVTNLSKESNNPIENFVFDNLSFTADGTGSTDHKFTIKNNSFDSLLNLLDEGIVVREKDYRSTGWVYDSTAWCVKLYHAPEVNALDGGNTAVKRHYVEFYKGKMVDGEFVADSNTPEQKMVFTNKYDEDIVTIKFPFVKKVTLGGNVAPAEEKFELEIFDIGSGDIESYPDVSYTADVKTNGEGEFQGEISITGPASQVEQFVCEGFYVREVNGEAENWTYSDKVWYVAPQWIDQEEGDLAAYPTTKETSEDGDYYIIDNEPAEEMVFENIYTANKVVVPEAPVAPEAPEAPATPEAPAAPEAPATGDSNNAALWLALLCVSGAGIAAISANRKNRAAK